MLPQVLVCCGVGGTGKTTTAAALGVAYARAGHSVVVLTIDPARRLADALRVASLGNEPLPVPLDGVGAPGTLDALMLDRKGTWDDVIQRNASPETAEKLLANRYYRAVSTRLSGSHEYMAVEKLYALATDGRWDVVVLDTPPTQHVVDFFRAPDRVRGIFDQSVLRVLVAPGTGLRGAAARGALGLVQRIAGASVMGDISEFFQLMGELSTGFRERSAAVSELLKAGTTRFFLVTHADAPDRNDLMGFLDELAERDLNLAGFLMNRVQQPPEGTLPDRDALMSAGAHLPDWETCVDALLALPADAASRATAHRRAAAELSQAADYAPVWLVPDVPGGVRSIAGLAALGDHLPPRPPDALPS